MYYLVKNPKCLTRVEKKVYKTFTNIKSIVSSKGLTDCYYLYAYINKAMCMAPPVPGALPQCTLLGSAKVDGYFLPKGMVAGTPCFAIHHKEKYFLSPFKFRPERWIDDVPA